MSTETPDTIYEILMVDHRTVSSLLEELADTAEDETEDRESLFAEVKQELLLHAQAEEAVVYDLLRQRPETRELAERAQREHQTVTRLLGALGRTPVDDEDWEMMMAELTANVLTHVEEEESELFAALRGVIDDERARTLGASFVAMKERLERGQAAA